MDDVPAYMRARRDDPDTSHGAAERAAEFAGKHKARIFAALRQASSGATKDEISRMTGIDPVAVARRMSELANDGLVEDSGLRRPTPTGRSAIVWRIKAAQAASA